MEYIIFMSTCKRIGVLSSMLEAIYLLVITRGREYLYPMKNKCGGCLLRQRSDPIFCHRPRNVSGRLALAAVRLRRRQANR